MVTFTSSHVSLVLLLFLCAVTFHRSTSTNPVRCNEKDHKILLIFKQGVIDDFNLLSTWSSEEDCCAWEGVLCDNTTARVTELDLNQIVSYDRSLKGEINLSLLLQLEFLNYLDLSYNSFEVISIPALDENVTLASNFHHLDLSWNYGLHVDNLQWLTSLSSLKYLYLSGIDLHKETNWLQMVALLPSLSELHLRFCKLNNISPSLKYVNFTSLTTLDLSFNSFNSKLPNWLFNLKSDLSYLYLISCSLHGEIPLNMPNLRTLRYLDLSNNQLNGSIPDWIGQLEHLQYLDVSHNMFSGPTPSTIGNISSLVSLGFGSNFFSGAISETFFSKLPNLKSLDLSNSTFAFNFDTKWNPPFQLEVLYLANTNQGPNFPSWIYTQKSLDYLDMSSSGISSINGDMFWRFVREIDSLYLSNNSIGGDISNITLNSTYIALDRNNFTGRLPHLSTKSVDVYLSHNSFSGPMPCGWENWIHLQLINLWSNRLSGEL